MNNNAAAATVISSASTYVGTPAKTQQQRVQDFLDALQKFDELQQQLREERESERKVEEKARQAKRERDKRINEISGLIAHYRQKVASDSGDTASQAVLSELQTKLFWLMFSM